ncbi:MAG: recombinase family protein [Pirellulaceae bacterium]
MNNNRRSIRCAIYTRKSHEEGLDQEFNSLDAQRQAGEAYIQSQRHEGWQCVPKRYDDGGFTGGNMDRPAMTQLIEDIRGGRLDCVVVYKVDRLSRSLLDFAKLIDVFDEHEVSFVSVTQQFNTTTSMGRLTLNILLSFAQFEREIIGERIRDKKLATARLGKYIGGQPVLGLDIVDKRYVVNRTEAKLVRRMFELFLELHSCRKVAEALNAEGVVTKVYRTKTGKDFGGKPWKGRTVYEHLTDRKYVGQIVHKDKAYPGEHTAIVKADLFEKVQDVLRANKTYTHRHQIRRSALLRGLLRCGECGSLIQPAWTTNHGREYRYYACSRRVKTGYDKCGLPTLPAGEIETMVVDQLRALLRHPDVIARTYREIQERSSSGPSQEATEQLAQLCQRREQLRESIRVLLGLAKQNEFMSDELKRLNGELNALDRSIGQLDRDRAPTGSIVLADVTDALQRIDPIWEVLHPDEQRRVLELLVEKITVSKERVEVRFRVNGIEQVTGELGPIGAGSDD